METEEDDDDDNGELETMNASPMSTRERPSIRRSESFVMMFKIYLYKPIIYMRSMGKAACVLCFPLFDWVVVEVLYDFLCFLNNRFETIVWTLPSRG
mmetsp:Transcript_51725/g.57787  ORF Transcript_51725/g.57787 Transcript_51725/m.57787 type:complete len:97 (-) Transcript_51725:61-351(-)